MHRFFSLPRGVSISLALLALGAPGCSFIVDGALHDRDTGSSIDGGPGIDAPAEMEDAGPPPTACTGRPDGTFCDIEGLLDREICVDGVCVVSSCGDGFSDTRTGHPSGIAPSEQCDDGNATEGDGCEVDCTFSCESAADCLDDTETCNGVPTCGAMHACTSEPLDELEPCFVVDTTPPAAGVCRSGTCRSGVCGNGTPEPGEECDDSNTTDDDGCDSDCTFTCETEEECQNGDACDGAEVCDTITHTCSDGTVPVCDDADPCTTDSCDASAGCIGTSVLVDADGDTFFAETATCGGDDCDDTMAAINPGAVEGCGTSMDLNCDGMVSAMPTFYRDCDGDGYAPTGATTMMACTMPTGVPSGCPSSGRWISRAPTSGSIDCTDSNSSARPGQPSYYTAPISGTNYDYDCSGSSVRQYPHNNGHLIIAACQFDTRGNCGGTSYWSAATAPACGATSTLSYCLENRITGSCTRTSASRVVACH